MSELWHTCEFRSNCDVDRDVDWSVQALDSPPAVGKAF